MIKKILALLILSLLLTDYSYAFVSGPSCSSLFQTRTGPQNPTIESNNLLQGRLIEIEQLSDTELQNAVYSILSSLLRDKSRSYPSVFEDIQNPKNFNWFTINVISDIKRKPETASLSSAKIKEALKWVITRGLEDLKELKSFNSN